VGICPPEQKVAPIIKESLPEHTEAESLLEALSRAHGSNPFDEKKLVLADPAVVAPPRSSTNKAGERQSSVIPQRQSRETSLGSGRHRMSPAPQQSRKSRLARGIVLALTLVCFIAGGALLTFILNGREPGPPPKPPTPGPTREQISPGPTREEMQGRLKDLKDRRASASDFEKLGQDALHYGHCQIARDAFEEADPGQSTEASWQLARMYDPRETAPAYRNCFQPNVGWAIRYYNMGAQKGSDRHRNELGALCGQSGGVVAGDEGLRQICRAFSG